MIWAVTWVIGETILSGLWTDFVEHSWTSGVMSECQLHKRAAERQIGLIGVVESSTCRKVLYRVYVKKRMAVLYVCLDSFVGFDSLQAYSASVLCF